MACERVVPNNNGYIYNTLSKIDQLQKETTIESYCEGCEGGLMERMYNTKPVSFYLQGGTKFAVEIPGTQGTLADTFRVEDVKSDAVVLRLLDLDATPQCLDYTVILNIGCVCSLQCFPPICCEPCYRCLNRN